MPSSSIFGLFELCVAAAMVGCSSTPATSDAGASACTVELSGNIADEGHPAGCAKLVQGDAGDWTLSIDTSTTAIARLHATFDVGAAPAPGTLTNETVTSWDLVALSSSTACTFQAGSDSVPGGSFTLTLTSVDTASGAAHGTLDVVASVHAPPSTDCGYDDVENVSIQF